MVDYQEFLKDFDTNRLYFPDGCYDFDFNDFKNSSSIIYQGLRALKQYRHPRAQKDMAIKILNLPYGRNIDKKNFEKDLKKFINEIKIHKSLANSSCIVDFYGLCFSSVNNETSLFLCMELMDCPLDSLYRYMHDKLIMSPKDLFELIADLIGFVAVAMVYALQWCKKSKIFHRDIKPQNILLNRYGQIKLSDFGESKIFEYSIANSLVGTCLYWPPERYETGESYGIKADIWSFGITLSEVAFGKRPFLDEDGCEISNNLIKLQNCIKNIETDVFIDNIFRNNYSSAINEFIRLCLLKLDLRADLKTLENTKLYRIYADKTSTSLKLKTIQEYVENMLGNIEHASELKFEYNDSDIEPLPSQKHSFISFVTKYQYIHKPSGLVVTKLPWTLIRLGFEIPKNPAYKYIFEKKGMKELSHSNIAELYSIKCLKESGKYLICMEPFDMSLDDFANIFQWKGIIFPEVIIGHIVGVVLKTLQELSMQNVVHGHMCPKDILFLKDGTIKLIGFQHLNVEIAQECRNSAVERSTSGYYLTSYCEHWGKLYDSKFDIWFFGIVLVQVMTKSIHAAEIEPILIQVMLLHRNIFSVKNEVERIQLQEEFIYLFDKFRNIVYEYMSVHYSGDCRDFIIKCLEEYNVRPDYHELMNTNFFVKHIESYQEDRKRFANYLDEALTKFKRV